MAVGGVQERNVGPCQGSADDESRRTLRGYGCYAQEGLWIAGRRMRSKQASCSTKDVPLELSSGSKLQIEWLRSKSLSQHPGELSALECRTRKIEINFWEIHKLNEDWFTDRRTNSAGKLRRHL
eukprot:746617-Hanusia_phi.AAC.3